MSRPPRPCYLPGCARLARARGLCTTHYQRDLAGSPNATRPIAARRITERASLGATSRERVRRLDAIAKSRGLTRAALLDAVLDNFLQRDET